VCVLEKSHFHLPLSFLDKICINYWNNSYSRGRETLRLPEIYQHGSNIAESISG